MLQAAQLIVPTTVIVTASNLTRSLFITSYGVKVGKKGNRLVVVSKSNRSEFSLEELDEVIIVGGGKSISSDLIELCVENKIPIFFTKWGGNPYAAVFPMIISGTVRRRRGQYNAFNTKLGLEIAKKFIIGKLQNQANIIKIWSKSIMRTDPVTAEFMRKSARDIIELIKKLQNIKGDRIDSVKRMELMNIEARGTEIYWVWFGKHISKVALFPGRIKRGARDPVNSLLNLGYSILLRKVFTAILFAGLDPYAGFLHSDRSGRPSLALDLMEEFRQQVVDKVVVRLLNKREIRVDECMDENGRLSESVIKDLLKEFQARYEENVVDIYGDKRTIQQHINEQARSLARYLIGESDDYKPFILPW